MDQTLSDYFIILSMEKWSAQKNRWVKIVRARFPKQLRSQVMSLEFNVI